MTQLIIPGLDASNLIVGGDALDSIATQNILPSLRINALNSEDTANGTIPAGSWTLVNNKNKTTLGKTIDVLPLAVRSMAIDMSGQGTTVVHDSESQAFRDIVAKANNSPPGQRKQAMYGPQILMVHDQQLVTLFCANQSMMGIYASIKASLMRWVTLTSDLTKSKKGQYFAPIFSVCLNPPETSPDYLATLAGPVKSFLTIASAPQVVPTTEDRPQ
jgi:hypothetical protein